MEELIKLVRTYRVTAGLAERLRLTEELSTTAGQSFVNVGNN